MKWISWTAINLFKYSYVIIIIYNYKHTGDDFKLDGFLEGVSFKVLGQKCGLTYLFSFWSIRF